MSQRQPDEPGAAGAEGANAQREREPEEGGCGRAAGSPGQPGPSERRRFLRQAGGLAAAALVGCAHGRGERPATRAPAASPTPAAPAPRPTAPPAAAASEPAGEARVRRYRTLGRTGFRVSDVSLGCGHLDEANVVRYAVDRGVTLLDTAERYGNGDSERKIGEALANLDRKKLFIVTKLGVQPQESAASIVERFGACLGRLRSDYADALYMHSVTDVAMVKHKGFHEAIRQLKAAGRVKHAGLSSHGPRGKGDSMASVLTAAAEDGRFDLMLFIYNFLNREEGQRVLAACKAKNIGVTLMKTAPVALKPERLDAASPSPDHARTIATYIGRGMTREQAVAALQERLAGQRAERERSRGPVDAFVARHGIKTQQQLVVRSAQWALANPDVHTVCLSMSDFESVDQLLPVSGTELSAAGARFLRDYARAFGAAHCRHGCSTCVASCPRGVPVSTVMRYAYYFEGQRREKHAMRAYAALGPVAERCRGCAGPCLAACPHGLDVRAQLAAAHDLLSLMA